MGWATKKRVATNSHRCTYYYDIISYNVWYISYSVWYNDQIVWLVVCCMIYWYVSIWLIIILYCIIKYKSYTVRYWQLWPLTPNKKPTCKHDERCFKKIQVSRSKLFTSGRQRSHSYKVISIENRKKKCRYCIIATIRISYCNQAGLHKVK